MFGLRKKTARYHLEEDLEQIRRFFPGAEPVTLHTPFDIHDRPTRCDLTTELPYAKSRPANQSAHTFLA